MEAQNGWIEFKDLDLDDPKFNVFSIDTRDFHCGYRKETTRPDILTLKKYPTFFFTVKEVRELIDRLHTESGGVGEWRFLDLNVRDGKVNNWRIKYIRIWRTEFGLLVCNSRNEAIKKEIWDNPVNKESLNFIAKTKKDEVS